MFTSTIILDGNVIVDGVSFRWWVRDGSEPLLAVSHHKFGTETAPLGGTEPAVQARGMAKRMLANRPDSGIARARGERAQSKRPSRTSP